MNRAFTGRSRLPLAALLLAAAVAGCRPGGDYGFDRVTYRETPEVPQPTNPDPPPVPVGGLAGATQARLVARNLPAGVTQAMVDEGQTQFGTVCVGCHGPAGTGTPAAPALNDASWINVSGAYPEIVTVINTGVPNPRQHTGAMPPKGGGSFTDDQVRALAAYVFALSRQGES